MNRLLDGFVVWKGWVLVLFRSWRQSSKWWFDSTLGSIWLKHFRNFTKIYFGHWTLAQGSNSSYLGSKAKFQPNCLLKIKQEHFSDFGPSIIPFPIKPKLLMKKKIPKFFTNFCGWKYCSSQLPKHTLS